MRGEDSDAPWGWWRTERITPACAGKTLPWSSSWRTRWDHPRMRGEDLTYLNSGSAVRGSPPHARGRPRPAEMPPVDLGITPACAGKTTDYHGAGWAVSDHPRMRGEDIDVEAHGDRDVGSPPHARGRLPCLGCRLWVLGDHPRMRGEDAGVLLGFGGAVGSPPHARGRRILAKTESLISRITPACAGKTKCRSLTANASRDHPRMRGEDS